MERNMPGFKRESVVRDPSTLSSLVPFQAREISYKSFRSSARMQGSHLMLLRRPSRVAEAAREYVAGDPVHLIDWKAFARTDQLIIREKRDEAAARVVIALDVSATMQWPGEHLQGASLSALPPMKADIATRVALHVAHMHLKRGDMVELRLLGAKGGDKPVLRLAPRSPSDIAGLFARLEHSGFAPDAYSAEFKAAKPLVSGRTPLADISIWVGDVLGDGDALGFLELGKRQVLLHVLSSLELDVNWLTTDVAYFDEGPLSHLKEYQGGLLKQENRYQLGLKNWTERLAAKLKLRGAAYVPLSDATMIAAYQRTLLSLGLQTMS